MHAPSVHMAAPADGIEALNGANPTAGSAQHGTPFVGDTSHGVPIGRTSIQRWPSHAHTSDSANSSSGGGGRIPQARAVERLATDEQGAVRRVPRLLEAGHRPLVAPHRAHVPDGLRAWGVTAQLYAARSAASWGVGDLGDLRQLVAWGRRRGIGAGLG